MGEFIGGGCLEAYYLSDRVHSASAGRCGCVTLVQGPNAGTQPALGIAGLVILNPAFVI